MKSSITKRRRGMAFTLVELLVVMGIIAILAAIVIAGISSALRFAKRTKAGATATQIQTAMQNYYAEYGVYPTQTGYPAAATGGDALYTGTASSATGWQNLMVALCGNVNPLTGVATVGNVTNTRGIAYLTPVRGDLDTTYGIPANPFGSSATSPYFYMAVDTDYSGVVGDSGAAQTQGLPDFSKYSTNYMGATLASGTPGGVAVWCTCDQSVGTVAKPSPAAWWAHTY
jgi:prepilin-type N-terminal cleavage/methylation domain-containing protein